MAELIITIASCVFLTSVTAFFVTRKNREKAGKWQKRMAYSFAAVFLVAIALSIPAPQTADNTAAQSTQREENTQDNTANENGRENSETENSETSKESKQDNKSSNFSGKKIAKPSPNGGGSSSGRASKSPSGSSKKQTVMVLYTRTGSKYHARKCGNGTYMPCTLSKARSWGLTPCKKCF